MDNKATSQAAFEGTLTKQYGFRRTDEEHLLLKKIFGKDMDIYISIENLERLGVTISPKKNNNDGLDLFQGKFSMEALKKLIERYSKIAKI